MRLEVRYNRRAELWELYSVEGFEDNCYHQQRAYFCRGNREMISHARKIAAKTKLNLYIYNTNSELKKIVYSPSSNPTLHTS
jgi:hypothetical protein